MKKNKLIYFILLLVCIPMVSTDIYIPSIPIIADSLSTTSNNMSLTLTSYMVGFSISMLLAGYLSDLFGKKKIINIFMTLYIICCLILTISSNIYIFVIARFFQGIFGGCGTVIGRLIVKELYPSNKEQISKMTTLTLSMAIAPAIAPFLGAMLTKYLSWHWCFIATLSLSIVIVLGINRYYFEELNIVIRPVINLKRFYIIPIEIVKVFNNKIFVGASLLITFTWTSYFCFIGLASIYFQNFFGFSEIGYSHVIMFVTVGYIIGTFITKYLNSISLEALTIINIGVIIFTITSIGIFFSILIHSLILIIISCMLMRLSIGFIMPTSQVLATNSIIKSNQIGWSMGCLLALEFLTSGFFVYCGSFVENYRLGYGIAFVSLISMIFVIYGAYLTKEYKSYLHIK